MQGCESLWNEVIRRAVMDAQGKGPAENSWAGKKGHRARYKEYYKRNALYFLNGGGTWELCCDVIGREPEEYTREILEGLNGHRKRTRRHATSGGKRSQKPVVAGTNSGQKRDAGKKGKSERMENDIAGKRGEAEVNMASESGDSQGLRGISAAGSPAGAYQYIAVEFSFTYSANEGNR